MAADAESLEVSNDLATIVFVDQFGLAKLKTKHDDTIYPFRFDKIRNYRGEYPNEIGLRNGATVRFSTEDGKIKAVEILSGLEKSIAR